MQLVVKECKQRVQSVTVKHKKSDPYHKTLDDTYAQPSVSADCHSHYDKHDVTF